MTAKEFSHHDHNVCVGAGMESALEKCARLGVKLTPVRQRVLEILLQQHRAFGAYDILEILRANGVAAQPPVAYRALDFLMSHGFVHRIEKLNAFVACSHPGDDHSPAFFICKTCDRVAETDAVKGSNVVSQSAGKMGFSVETAVIEALGTCSSCLDTTQ